MGTRKQHDFAELCLILHRFFHALKGAFQRLRFSMKRQGTALHGDEQVVQRVGQVVQGGNKPLLIVRMRDGMAQADTTPGLISPLPEGNGKSAHRLGDTFPD